MVCNVQVLLFDAADEASLQAVTAWAEQYSAAEAAPEPEIKLCVAILAAPAEPLDGEHCLRSVLPIKFANRLIGSRISSHLHPAGVPVRPAL